MALFGTPNAYIGLDIGTSSLKLIELVNRRRRLDVATYAEANLANPLLHPTGATEDAVRAVSNVVSRMLEQAEVAADAVVAALPSSIVFTTVIDLPDVEDEEMDAAVRFAARDVVPANLNEMSLSWVRLPRPAQPAAPQQTEDSLGSTSSDTVPIYITAAPAEIVERYTQVVKSAGLDLVALEVETFPLIRALLAKPTDSAFIIDLGDRTTAYHVIDRGVPRFSHTLDAGGHHVTKALATALAISDEAAQQAKVSHGITDGAAPEARQAIMSALQPIIEESQRLAQLHSHKAGHTIERTVLIGGGANLPGLPEAWSSTVGHGVTVGDPWQGLSFPNSIQDHIKELGATYAVAIGLARRNLPTI